MATDNAAQWLLDRHVDEGAGSSPCFRSGDRVVCYGEVLDLVARFGALLADAGIGAGQRVLVALPDSVPAAVVILGVIRAGAVAIPLSTRLRARDYARIIADAQPDAAVMIPQLSGACADLGPARWWLPDGEPAHCWRSLATELATARANAAPARTRPDDIALMQYTSGSTGEPRGVLHRHEALCTATRGLVELLGIQPDDIMLSASKLAFGYGLGNSVLVPMSVGASSVLSAEPAEPSVIARDLARHRPTIFFAVPTLYAALLRAGDPTGRFPLRGGRAYVSSGEHLSSRLGERCMAAFGTALSDVFGCTETLYSFAGNVPGTWEPHLLGQAFPGYELAVRPPGEESGELWVRGPGVAAGYWRRPEQTAHAFKRGWVRTGDTARHLQGGRLSHLGRSDDVIKVRGFKVAPAEVEDVLSAHPAVAACAVVGVPGDDGLTRLAAYVVRSLAATADSADELRGLAQRELSPHQRPGSFHFVDELPRTVTGKTSRHLLRVAAAASTGR